MQRSMFCAPTPSLHPVPPDHLRLSHNLVHRLVCRSRHRPCPSAGASNQRILYLNIYPNATHFGILDEPSVAIRKFSPCGRYLLTFSRMPNVNQLQVFSFKSGGRSAPEFPVNRWEHYFEPHFSTALPHTLNKDFCLFTRESRFVLIACSRPTTVADPACYLREYPEALKNIKVSLEDVTIGVVDMRDGTICSQKEFKCDHINFAHNTGTYLYRDLLAVMSLQTQQIHLMKICENGDLLDLQIIGSICYPDDSLYLKKTRGATPPPVDMPEIRAPKSLNDILRRDAPAQETPPHAKSDEGGIIVGVKQRLLAYLWHRAKRDPNSANALRFFYYHFEEYRALCMWKMQIIDDRHLMIKYGSAEHVASQRTVETNGMLSYFVVYDFITTQIINVYENNSKQLLDCYERCADQFRDDASSGRTSFLSTPENSLHSRAAFRRQLHAVRTARNGGIQQSMRRGLAVLPIAAQNYRESPYFDSSLFSFDEKAISHADRLKHCVEFSVKFYSRMHGGVVFKIHTGLQNDRSGHQLRTKRLASYVFHPFLPFAISVQHVIKQGSNTISHTNFHYRGGDDGV